MTASGRWNSYCGGAHGRHKSSSRGRNIIVGLLAVLLSLQLVACQQGGRKLITAAQQPNALRNRRNSLLKALMVAGGYTSDPYFRPQKPIVLTLWDISTGKPATVAILISGGPYSDLRGMVARIGARGRVHAPIKIVGLVRYLRPLEISYHNRGPDSVVLYGINGWYPTGSTYTYHVVTLVKGRLVETLSATGDSSNSVAGTPPTMRISSLIRSRLPGFQFSCLCLFSESFGSRPGISATLWRWDPSKLQFMPLSRREIASVNSDVLKWARGVKW